MCLAMGNCIGNYIRGAFECHEVADNRHECNESGNLWSKVFWSTAVAIAFLVPGILGLTGGLPSLSFGGAIALTTLGALAALIPTQMLAAVMCLPPLMCIQTCVQDTDEGTV